MDTPQQIVVKMVHNGGTRSPSTLKRQWEYLSQGGNVRLEFSDSHGGPEEALNREDFSAVAQDWAVRTGKYQPGQSIDEHSPALTTHIVISFRAGTDEDRAYRAGRNFAARMFDVKRRRDGHDDNDVVEHRFDYMTAFHTDKDHPHLHIVVNRRSTGGGWLKASNRNGERSEPGTHDLFTFADFRHGALESAIDEGILCEATSRAERGLPRRNITDPQYRLNMPKPVTKEEDESRWAAVQTDRVVRLEGEIDDHSIGYGEFEELDRGHTPAPEWEDGTPLDQASDGPGRQLDTEEDAAVTQQQSETMLFDTEGSDDEERLVLEESGSSARHADPQDGGDNDADTLDVEDDRPRSRRSRPSSPEPEQAAMNIDDAPDSPTRPLIAEVEAAHARANGAQSGGDADMANVEDREQRESRHETPSQFAFSSPVEFVGGDGEPAQQEEAALARSAESARAQASRRRERERQRSAEAEAGPSRRRTPGGMVDITRDNGEGTSGRSPGQHENGQANPAEDGLGSQRRRIDHGPPNVSTRSMNEPDRQAARENWERLEEAGAQRARTRTQQRELDAARDEWLRLEREVQEARSNRRDRDAAAGPNRRRTPRGREDVEQQPQVPIRKKRAAAPRDPRRAQERNERSMPPLDNERER